MLFIFQAITIIVTICISVSVCVCMSFRQMDLHLVSLKVDSKYLF